MIQKQNLANTISSVVDIILSAIASYFDFKVNGNVFFGNLYKGEQTLLLSFCPLDNIALPKRGLKDRSFSLTLLHSEWPKLYGNRVKELISFDKVNSKTKNNQAAFS